MKLRIIISQKVRFRTKRAGIILGASVVRGATRRELCTRMDTNIVSKDIMNGDVSISQNFILQPLFLAKKTGKFRRLIRINYLYSTIIFILA